MLVGVRCTASAEEEAHERWDMRANSLAVRCGEKADGAHAMAAPVAAAGERREHRRPARAAVVPKRAVIGGGV
jgi:hypothetical protein